MWRCAFLAALVGIWLLSSSTEALSATPLTCNAGAVPGGLPAPDSVAAAPTGHRSISGKFSALVTWEAGSNDATCFGIERALGIQEPEDSDFQVIVLLRAGEDTAFVDQGPFSSGGPIAYYRVFAANDSARSTYSQIAYASFPVIDTPPPTPTQSSISRGDLNCDGAVDVADTMPILRNQAGLDPNLPTNCPGILSNAEDYAGLLAIPAVVFLGALVLSRRHRVI